MATFMRELSNASFLPHKSAAGVTADDFIVTSTQNFVSRQAHLHDASRIALQGRTIVERHSVLQGPLRVGRYCHVQSGCTLRPSTMLEHPDQEIPTVIGSHTSIGMNCTIEAAAIGSYCWIGDDVRIGARVIIKDCCILSSGVSIPDDTVIPPFSYVSQGLYQRQLTAVELPPSTAAVLQERSSQTYVEFNERVMGGVRKE
jgi:dynactin 5